MMNTPTEEPIDEVKIENEDDMRSSDKPNNGSIIEETGDRKTERHIGKYQVSRRIGCGGMAEVYEVLSSAPEEEKEKWRRI